MRRKQHTRNMPGVDYRQPHPPLTRSPFPHWGRLEEIIRGILIFAVPIVDGLYLLGLAGTLERGGDIGSLAGRIVIALAVLIVYTIIVRAWAKKNMEDK